MLIIGHLTVGLATSAPPSPPLLCHRPRRQISRPAIRRHRLLSPHAWPHISTASRRWSLGPKINTAEAGDEIFFFKKCAFLTDFPSRKKWPGFFLNLSLEKREGNQIF